ncbi:transcriptional regulator, AbrB family [Deinococcus aerius]|uniref:Transcriptional regulator, AbrB family n=1 Tax=Deinococcus aerius TaxID=200253 RepID=A0A2I9CRN4_9DEIO|nr:transcriptional regulator, AbrB family [Deinococcus aerius]
MRLRVKLENGHRLTLPPEVVEMLALQEGDTLVLTLEEGRVVLQSQRQVTRAIQSKYARPEFSGMVEELIAERRAEAERE